MSGRTEVHRTHCARMDHGGCGLLVTVENGRVVKVQGDPDSPVSRGYVCAKGLASVERLYHPDRLLHPLVREGERGEGRWKKASWQEAIRILSSKILEVVNDQGAQSVLFCQGAPKGLEFFLLMRLANALGSPNVAGPQNLCHMPREIGASMTCGFWTEVDYDHPPSCIVLWGSNLDQTNEEGTISSRLRSSLDRGSRLIVVDPRPTRMAKRADVWLRLRPGTDAALALGMMRAMVDEGLEDKEFVRGWTVGFPELERRLQEYPLSRVEEITWVPAGEIARAVRLYARMRPAAIQWGNALEHTVESHQAIRAVVSLMALSGNLEVPGGNIRPTMPPAMPLRDFVLPRQIPDRRRRMISGPWGLHPMLATVPVQMATRALLEGDPYPLKVVYLQGTNPMITYPDSQRVMEAFSRVEFLAVADIFMTPTAAMADLVLPAATNFEYDDIGHYGMVQGMLLARPKIVEPPGEAWSDLKIINELGKALGLEEHFWGTESEILEAVLAPSGLNYQAFCAMGVLRGEKRYRSYLEGGFKTPSGKVELLSSQLEEMGLDPLPGYADPVPEREKWMDQYPLIMTSAKDPVFFHSGNRQIDSLRNISKDPEVEMAPETARRLGIENGDWVRIMTPRGEIRQKARLVPGMDPRVVCAAYGWWFPEKGPKGLFGWRDSNINVLTSMEPPYNPVVGSVNLRSLPCSVEREG